MKKMFIVLFLTSIFLVLVQNISKAQFKLAVAPAIGMNFNIHTGSDLKESGNGFGLGFGGYADMAFTPTVGLIAGLAFYDNRSGSTSSTGSEQVPGVGTVNFTQDVDVSLAYFQIESLFKLTIPRSGFYFVMGPVLGFNISGETETTTTITTQGVTFQDGTNKQKAKSSLKDTQVRFELKGGAGYDISVSRLITLAPQFSFGYGLTNVVKDIKWKVLTIQGLVSVKFNLI